MNTLAVVLGVVSAGIANSSKSPVMAQGIETKKENDKSNIMHGGESKEVASDKEMQDFSVTGQVQSIYTTLSENLSALVGESKQANTGSEDSSDDEKETKTDVASSALPTDAWYTSVLSTLESITAIGQGTEEKPSDKSSESKEIGSKDICADAENEAEYLNWVTSARKRLEELSQKVQRMDWKSFSVNEDKGIPEKSGIPVLDEAATEDGEIAIAKAKVESGNSIKQHLLEQINAVQAHLGQKVDQTRLALEEAVHRMLPEQLQRPWVTACAQNCLDQDIHSELLQSATVRFGNGICDSEAEFRAKRLKLIRRDFAEFIRIPEASVDYRDIPIIGVAGSGGGFRAMVSTIGSYRTMHQVGLAQCVMYDAAVSGSSWAMAALHTYAQGDPCKVVENVRNAMQYSMFSTSNLLSFVKGNDSIAKRVFTDMAARYLLAAAKIEDAGKSQSDTDIRSVDANSNSNDNQGTLIGGLLTRVADAIVPDQLQHLYRKEPIVPSPLTIDELVQVTKTTVKTVSVPPMSIVELYGALLFKQLIVQHENASESKSELRLDSRWMKLSSQGGAVEQGVLPMPIYTAVRHFLGTDDNKPENVEDHRYQWFEFNPYEVGSIDHGMWIPTWAFGRPMVNGKEQFKIGETHFGSIMGMVSSAFCASVKAMVMEFYMAVPEAVRSAMDPLLDRFERETETSHIIPPYTLYNPFFKPEQPAKESISDKREELEGAPFLSLMDAGLENNLPFAPLLRPERSVDVLICLDSSANIDVMPWFARAEAWASEHGVERWPWGARPWTADPLRPSKAEIEMSKSTLKSTKKVLERVEDRVKHKNMRCVIFDHPLAPMPDKFSKARKLDPTISVLYLPLLSNPKFRDPDFDPAKADFCATFNDKWTAEQVDMLADLTSLNFSQEIERIRAAIKKAYERKRAFRLYKEAKV
ncbi:hypothetical protein J3B02_003533 [Coemansia erecta]|nr:hypothetical protein J3B02_003533 [Coemansia erecta]